MASNLIPKIRLSADEQERLKNRLDEMIIQAEDFRQSSRWSRLHELYWRLYFAEPEYEVKNWPWENASNLFIPLTQVVIAGIMAQEFDAMLSNDPTVKVVGLDEEQAEAEQLSLYYGDYFYRQKVNLRQLGSDWLLDNLVDGTSAVKVRLNRDYRVRRRETIEDLPVMEKIKSEFLGEVLEVEQQTGVEQRIVEDATIERIDEVEAETVDLERIHVAPDTGPDLQYPTCRWYYQTQDLAWEDLIARRMRGYDVPDDLRSQLGERETSEKERLIREREGTSESATERTVRVCEFYMRWQLPTRYRQPEEGEREWLTQAEGEEDGYEEEVIVTYAPRARHLLNIRPLSRVCPDGERPHILNHYHRIPRYIYGMGIPSKMRHLNSAINSGWNQRIDYGTIQNIPWYFYNPASSGTMPDLFSLQPGQGVPTLDPRGVTFPRFNGDPNFFLMSDQQIQMWAERVGNINDYNLGRSPNLPNAQRTARGTMALLQQANIGFSLLIAMHAEGFVKFFRKVHAYKAKATGRDGAEFRVTNRERSRLIRGRVPQDAFRREVDFEFVLNPNRLQEQQAKQVLWSLTLQGLTLVMQSPQLHDPVRNALADLYDSFGVKNFPKIWPKQPPAQIAGPQPGVTGGPPSPSSPPALANVLPFSPQQFAPAPPKPPEPEEENIDL